MHTLLVDQISLVSGEVLFLVHHEVRMEESAVEQLREQKRLARARLPPPIDPTKTPSLRAQMFGYELAAGRYGYFLDTALD